jgi:phosphoglycolate phosphatase
MTTFLGAAHAHMAEEAVRLYRQRYGTTGLYEASVYAGVPDLLVALEGRAAYVATSKARVYASRIVDHFGLAGHFRGIYGPDLEGQPDSKSALLAQLVQTEAMNGQPVMIGDRAEDVYAAKANGALAAAVLWGYGSQQELLDAGAHVLCATPAELARFLVGL